VPSSKAGLIVLRYFIIIIIIIIIIVVVVVVVIIYCWNKRLAVTNPECNTRAGQ